ncbi:PilZ domain-containing protein [Aquibaculum arenosum]|uniref:PilZ domain-containing protein n=1 Tax=Aquibaculum arenosum TaxID=3032591 RepID=A0ABT5YLH7_9PROT|nr:PilZ domain-containing protein [Fodinicurvata sp. CAU 1616]MDF2095768.1 PilZ domain-containing protein [Fodinicurvata sp. CAU 1616]
MSGIGQSEEDRRSERRQTLLSAQLTLRPDEPPLSAIIRNISQHGALIQLEMIETLPEQFQLSIPKLQVTRRVRVVWKRGYNVGVEFGKTLAEATRAPGEIDLLHARVAALEATVKSLEARIRQLTGED